MAKITVVVRVDGGGDWLIRLVESLDAQTLPYDQFDIVFVAAAEATQIAARLGELSMRRPNVVIVEASIDTGIDSQDVTPLATAEWLLDLGPQLAARNPVLFPQALARLVQFGEQNSCDVVLGRTVARSSWVSDHAFAADEPSLDSVPPASDGPAPMVLRRIGGTGAVGVQAAYPTAVVSWDDSARTIVPGVLVTRVAYEWRSGRVGITVEGVLDGAGADVAVHFAVRAEKSRIEFRLPSKASVTGAQFEATTELDLMTAAAGEPLGTGRWQIAVTAAPPGRRLATGQPLPVAELAAGIVDGVLVAPTAKDGTFVLDIGAKTASVVGKLATGDVTITESARGTVLVAALPELAVVGESRLRGSVLLGKFVLPADLIVAGGQARLEAFVSGLAGTSVLSTRFAEGIVAPTGLSLTISPVGQMTVAPTPPPKPSGRTAASRSKSAAVSAATQQSLVRRLRRKVPASLEPAVQALARNRYARRAYRSLIGLPPAR